MPSIDVHLDLELFVELAEAGHCTALLSVSSEADMANLAFCKISSGGGTGSTTGAELTECLLRSTTSMGPLMLFRWIWYLTGLSWT